MIFIRHGESIGCSNQTIELSQERFEAFRLKAFFKVCLSHGKFFNDLAFGQRF